MLKVLCALCVLLLTGCPGVELPEGRREIGAENKNSDHRPIYGCKGR